MKWVLAFSGDAQAETVFIPEPQRGTICVSSQAGCSLKCSFCHTGTQKLKRNLTAAEIVAQVMHVRMELDDRPMSLKRRKATHIVLMGQGEPLLNYTQVRKACEILSDGDGLAFSTHKITLSTSGIAPLIPKVGSELGVNLAVSLHSAKNNVRDVLVPINRQYPISVLIKSCHEYRLNRTITFEYVMLDGVNDSDEDARAVYFLLRNLNCFVNLIPFNPWPGTEYRRSSDDRINSFQQLLLSLGLKATIRHSRGSDILAACGQLKSGESKAFFGNSAPATPEVLASP
eukprot:TRINITY_DN6022_c0_g1_i2.p1 TRINITY_DN6022_c0_g1~~TRINITY_DN6022_c0_g1_i2.p1  ORF type:complete len:320 (-),score=42.74 TRINITY_DN6022_c0_g1_i2:28-888(-)